MYISCIKVELKFWSNHIFFFHAAAKTHRFIVVLEYFYEISLLTRNFMKCIIIELCMHMFPTEMSNVIISAMTKITK